MATIATKKGIDVMAVFSSSLASGWNSYREKWRTLLPLAAIYLAVIAGYAMFANGFALIAAANGTYSRKEPALYLPVPGFRAADKSRDDEVLAHHFRKREYLSRSGFPHFEPELFYYPFELFPGFPVQTDQLPPGHDQH